MMAVAAIVLVVLALLSLRGVRWAYIAFIVMGLAYFPVKVGFRFAPRACELLVLGLIVVLLWRATKQRVLSRRYSA